ncbi:MAG: hypothetical protein OJF51_002118 [Nitrospira sp.]|nr:MAG: hypothetical protein OJF51_002118 [Nitrospira sp.]
MNDSLVTIIGSSYFEPISLLLERLDKYDSGNSNEVQAGYKINGFASAICILAVVCLEAYVMRGRYINNATQNEIDKVSVPVYLKKLYQDFPFDDDLFEIHILRDALVHNHLWEVSYSCDDEMAMILQSVNKRSSGDTKYQRYVDTETNLTKKLRLNVSPIKVGKSDAISVLQTMWKILIFLEKKNTSQCYVSHLRAVHKGKHRRFGEILGMPETCT